MLFFHRKRCYHGGFQLPISRDVVRGDAEICLVGQTRPKVVLSSVVICSVMGISASYAFL